MKKIKDEGRIVAWAVKNAIIPSIFIGVIMAVICLIACRNDPLKENIYRVIGTSLSCFLFMTVPFFIIPIMGLFLNILALPIHIFDLIFNNSKTKK